MRFQMIGGFMVFLVLSVPGHAQLSEQQLRADDQQVSQWNKFVDELYRLHERQIDGRKIKTTEQIDGYHMMPEFYREVFYYDKDSGRLLSRVAWEREHPDRLHEIEVFVYDERGRVKRDFLARFLPIYRNAPVQTLINFHGYSGDAHSFRQFDASDNLIYENCRGNLNGEEILIDLEEDQIMQAKTRENSIMDSLDYEVCFGDLPRSAGKYLRPQ